MDLLLDNENGKKYPLRCLLGLGHPTMWSHWDEQSCFWGWEERRIYSERWDDEYPIVVLRLAGVAAVIVCSTNQAFLSFPEPWRAFSMRFRWSGLRDGLWKTRSGATCQSSLQGRTFLASESAVSSLQLSALCRYLHIPDSRQNTSFLGWMASKDWLIVGQLLRPSMFSLSALKSPLCPRAPRWGWAGVACWVCITVWFLPPPASTVLIPNQYPTC